MLILEILFVSVLALVPAAIMTHVSGTLNCKLSLKFVFLTHFLVTVSGALLGALISSCLMPDESYAYKLGLYVFGPGSGFCIAEFLLMYFENKVKQTKVEKDSES